MKKIAAMVLAAAALFALTGCKSDPKFDAIVTEVYEDRIVLYVEEGQEFRETTDIVEISPEGLEDIGAEVGDRVTVTHTGQLMMSLPPQVSVVEWEIAEKGVGVPEGAGMDQLPAYDPETME